jgi:hypothetical protein
VSPVRVNEGELVRRLLQGVPLPKAPVVPQSTPLLVFPLVVHETVAEVEVSCVTVILEMAGAPVTVTVAIPETVRLVWMLVAVTVIGASAEEAVRFPY